MHLSKEPFRDQGRWRGMINSSDRGQRIVYVGSILRFGDFDCDLWQ